MKIKDILNDISPRIKAKKDINKRFKRRKGKAFHSKPDFNHKFKVYSNGFISVCYIFVNSNLSSNILRTSFDGSLSLSIKRCIQQPMGEDSIE